MMECVDFYGYIIGIRMFVSIVAEFLGELYDFDFIEMMFLAKK